MNELVIEGAGFQSPSPACEATIRTIPVLVKDSADPTREAEPLRTEKVTGRPEEAEALNVGLFVVSWLAIPGKSMVWLVLTATAISGCMEALVNVIPNCLQAVEKA
jgi:hypothetical protein